MEARVLEPPFRETHFLSTTMEEALELWRTWYGIDVDAYTYLLGILNAYGRATTVYDLATPDIISDQSHILGLVQYPHLRDEVFQNGNPQSDGLQHVPAEQDQTSTVATIEGYHQSCFQPEAETRNETPCVRCWSSKKKVC